jgi:Fungal specific transcription factor domain
MRGNSGALALQHIKGARHLLHTALRLPSSQLSGATRVFLIERYAYLVTLGHGTMGTEADSWVLEDAALLFPILKAEQGPRSGMTLGCVHELFYFIPAVTILARNQQREALSGLHSWRTASEYRELSSVIEVWTPTSDDEAYNLCGLVYQQALLLYLKSSYQYSPCFTDDEEYSTEVCAMIDIFIPLLQSFDIESLIITTLMWPIAVFGACTKSPAHRDIFLQSLDSMSSVHAVTSVKETRKVLEILWSQKGYEASPLSIEAVMKDNDMVVLFL